jgi:HK97 family phage portal protein
VGFGTWARRILSSSWNLDGRGYVSGGGGTYAGEPMDRDRALESATFYACANLVGSVISSLGFDVYRKNKSGSQEVVSDHSLHEVIKYEPNRNGTAVEFWQRFIWDQELSGNAFAKIVRDSRGDVVGLIPWEPDRVTLETNRPEWRYKFQPGDGRPPEYLDQWGERDEFANVFHLRNVTADGKLGISTADLASQRLGLDLAVEKYGARFFGMGGRVKDIFKVDAVPTPEQRSKFTDIFRSSYGNSDSSNEVLLLEKGMEYVTKSGATPNEAQFLETQVQNAIMLCRFWGIPSTLVGIYDRMSYNSQEQLMLQFLTLSLVPRVERIEQAARRALLTRADKRKGLFIHSKVQKVLRGDMKARGEFYKTLMSLGSLNADEVRDLEDMPRIGTPEAQEYRRAANIFGPETPADAGAAAGAEAGADAARTEAQKAAA